MTVHDLHRLGKRVAEQMGEGPGEERIAAQRELVQETLQAPPQRDEARFRLPALAGVAGLAVLVAGFSWWFWSSTPKQDVAPEEGMVLTARTTPLVMELPRGNSARLAPDSVGQLALSTPEEVRVVLIHGELTSSVRTPVRWSVQAGPYLVTAAGTEYVVRWQNEKLEVIVQTGRVRVLGKDSPEAGWLVEAGEHMTIDRGRLLEKVGPVVPPAGTPQVSGNSHEDPTAPGVDPRGTKTPKDAEDAGTPAPPVSDLSTPGRPGASTSTVPATTPGMTPPPEKPETTTTTATIPGEPPSPPPAPPAWKSMILQEEYAQAVAWIEKQGLSHFADSASLADLQAMANAARYAGRGQTSVVLLVSLRTRFPGTAQAATAAFLMGRVYSEQMKDHRAAVSWFSTYLAEVPSGSLVEEALGRKMDAAQRAGMTAEAKKTASQLVKQYPMSPFRPLADQILGIQK